MKKLFFKPSSELTLGVELEIQLVHPVTFDLTGGAKDLIRQITESKFQDRIKPEITQSMIEINSSVHASTDSLYQELLELHDFLIWHAQQLGIAYCGGGTHPFQKWSLRKIFPTKRFKILSRQYRYLSKQSTVFGLHVHIGCRNAEDALYLTHALTRYVPHLIAMSASSPFYQGVDTGYQSCRSNIFHVFPSSGTIPYLTSWQAFSTYYYKMKHYGIIRTMKDFYWDIRPKPEYGTVEVRVCDMPLTIYKSVMISAYIQTLSHYLLTMRPIQPSHDLYFLYNFNRFQAIRYGFDGNFIDAENGSHQLIFNDLLTTFELLESFATQLNNQASLNYLKAEVIRKFNDTLRLKRLLKQVGSFPKLVHRQCEIWSNETKPLHLSDDYRIEHA